MDPFDFSVHKFRVTIRLNRLECIKEYDASGHSEPYIWTAFIRGDASTFSDINRIIDIQVPFETETGRGLFGNAGKGVEPGDIIFIPAALGANTSTVQTFPIAGKETVFLGFIVVLLEEDDTPVDAMRAGHRAFAESLREEITRFAVLNRRLPTEDEIQVIKDKIATRVKDAVKGKLSWYHFWTAQDDLIGFLGGEQTFFTTDKIRLWAGKGPQEFRTAIQGTETAIQNWRPIPKEHHYDLFWSIEVKKLDWDLAPPAQILLKRVEDIGKKLQQLDTHIGELVKELDMSGKEQRTSLLLELEEKKKHTRPEVILELASAWESFVHSQNSNSKIEKSGSC